MPSKTKIPAGGLTGDAVREATRELRDLVGVVVDALHKHVGESDCYLNVAAIYPDSIVVELRARYYRYSYQLDDQNVVTFTGGEEVTKEFKTLRESAGAFIESIDGENNKPGTRWRIRVIKAGRSGNNNFYSDNALRESVTLFNNARVFVKGDEEHLKGGGKDFRNLIGRLTDPVFVEGKSTDSGETQATLEVLESAGGIAERLLEAHEKGMTDLFGFSIDALAQTKRRGNLREAARIVKVQSVDLIVEPGAGGEIISLIEAQQTSSGDTDMLLRERMIEAIKAAHDGKLPTTLDTDNDEALETAYREALIKAQNKPVTKQQDDPGEKKSPGSDGGYVTHEQFQEAVGMFALRSQALEKIVTSGLPQPAIDKLKSQYAGMASFTEAQVDAAIKAEREYLGKFTESGKIDGLGENSFIEAGEDRAEKVADMLDAFFDPEHKDHRNVRSFKEAYIDITGDRYVTGKVKDLDRRRFKEALGPFRETLNSGSFADLLGDSITRRMIREYNLEDQYSVWRLLADVVPVNDFRTQERTRFGGYGNLPAVAEEANYLALSSPNDEAASYAVTKRGGTERISLEMIKNDDMGAIRRIPIKLGRAAKRTLSQFGLDFLSTNPTVYDTNALFSAPHNNLGAAALDAASLAARRLAMLQQTEMDSGDRLGIGARHLWVPTDLEETAADLFRRNTENDKTFAQSLALNVIPVWYWTDTNNWFLTADKMDIATLEIGFLDGNEEPDLFIQDNPTQGSLFANDTITYKIRHVYGGNILDYRGAQGSIVA